MRKSAEVVSWVVYKMSVHGKAEQRNAVCEQSEWDAMELAKPGLHTLIQEGIASESAAERLARGTSGDPKVRGAFTIGPALPKASVATEEGSKAP